MKTIGSLNYETTKEAGIKAVEFIGHGAYVLLQEDGKKELWQGHTFPNHSGYGIKYRGLILEFVRSL